MFETWKPSGQSGIEGEDGRSFSQCPQSLSAVIR